MKNSVLERIAAVRANAERLAVSSDRQRSELLEVIVSGLIRDQNAIFEANHLDVQEAVESGLAQSVLGRLKFDEAKLDGVVNSVRDVAMQPDPIGKVLMRKQLDDNLLLEKISVPMGVIGMVFEARPDALVQIVSLCLKSGNCLVLKGGKEAQHSNRALMQSIQKSCEGSFAGSDWVLLLESHEDVAQMLKADGLIDLMIPRGSYKFVQFVRDNTRIPVLGHAEGLCNMYIDKSAFVGKAVVCALDAKINYPAACNAVENLIVHRDIAGEFLPLMAKSFEANGVEMVGDAECCRIIGSGCAPATPEDWDAEYLGLKISIKMVDSLVEAISFIGEHSSHHTDAIISEDRDAVREFLSRVDSADVFANCSTRFSDGFRFGLGAEVGISTSRVHARGPVGLEGLMTTKFLVQGQGQIVQTYMGTHARVFKHEDLGTEGPSRILSLQADAGED